MWFVWKEHNAMFGQLRGILVNGRILDYFPSLHLQSPQQQKQSSSTSSLWFPIRQTVFRLTAGGPLLYILDMTAVITVWQRWPGNNTAVIYSIFSLLPKHLSSLPYYHPTASPSAWLHTRAATDHYLCCRLIHWLFVRNKKRIHFVAAETKGKTKGKLSLTSTMSSSKSSQKPWLLTMVM